MGPLAVAEPDAASRSEHSAAVRRGFMAGLLGVGAKRLAPGCASHHRTGPKQWGEALAAPPHPVPMLAQRSVVVAIVVMVAPASAVPIAVAVVAIVTAIVTVVVAVVAVVVIAPVVTRVVVARRAAAVAIALHARPVLIPPVSVGI